MELSHLILNYSIGWVPGLTLLLAVRGQRYFLQIPVAESGAGPAPPIDSRLHKRTSFERCAGGYRYARTCCGFGERHLKEVPLPSDIYTFRAGTLLTRGGFGSPAGAGLWGRRR